MRRIRNLPAPVFRAAGQWWGFEAFVWRLAPATGLLALLALAALINFSLIADGEVFRLFYAETQMLSLLDF